MGLSSFFKKELIDSIDGAILGDNLVYQYPRQHQMIAYGAQLTVNAGQVAIWVDDNGIADLFGSGVYSLTAEKLPLLAALQHWHEGSKKPFSAEIYFLNSHCLISQQWGIYQPVIVDDKDFGEVSLRVFGSYTLKIAQPKFFLENLLDSSREIDIEETFEKITSAIIDDFPSALKQMQISLSELPMRHSELSKRIKQNTGFLANQYGLEINHLTIDSLSLPKEVQKQLTITDLEIINADDMTELPMTTPAKAQQTKPMKTPAVHIENTRAITDDASDDVTKAGKIATETAEKAAVKVMETVPEQEKERPSSLKVYYLMVLGERQGPLDIHHIYDKLKAGEIDAQTIIWRAGMNGWQSIESLSEIDLNYLPEVQR